MNIISVQLRRFPRIMRSRKYFLFNPLKFFICILDNKQIQKWDCLTEQIIICWRQFYLFPMTPLCQAIFAPAFYHLPTPFMTEKLDKTLKYSTMWWCICDNKMRRSSKNCQKIFLFWSISVRHWDRFDDALIFFRVPQFFLVLPKIQVIQFHLNVFHREKARVIHFFTR